MIKKLHYSLAITFFTVSLGWAQTACSGGKAGAYPCKDYDLMSNLPVATLANSNLSANGSAPEGSDVWGWTDPTTNKEYAIAAMTNSTAFVDISDPVNPVFLGRLDSNAGNNFWRDVKVYNNHAFIVADNTGNHGMQVFDLTRLRGVSTPQTFTADQVFTDVSSCHNIVINEAKGIAYLVGCRATNGGGPIFVDISDPKNPKNLGDYKGAGYSHDAQVVTYKGPDAAYTNKEIYIGSNENEIVVLDVTDKTNVKKISAINYSQIGYTHQGWFTDDHRYFILGDETDERNFGMNTRTLVFDLADLDNPKLSSTYFGPTKAIDHNGYVKGKDFFMASYRAGMRVLDLTNISASTNAMTEKAYFDTFPADDNAGFAGAWSVYPYFPSGNIIINDIQRGLFVVRKSGTLSMDSVTKNTVSYQLSPNPTQSNPTITTVNGTIKSVVVYTILGKKVFSSNGLSTTRFEIPMAAYAKGIYLVRINGSISKKLIVQ